MPPPSLAAPNVRFVLVEPQTAGNVGSTARALKNLGFTRLVLVRPACDPHDGEARRLAVDARDLLESAEIHDDLDEALGDSGTVVGTTRRVGKQRQPHYRIDDWAEEMARLVRRGSTSFIFGREDSGLTDQELDRCTHLVYLPAAAVYPSFNLAQAVLLVGWELQLALEAGTPRPDPEAPPAGHDEREAFYAHFERALRTIGYVHDDTTQPIMRRFRRLLGRASASSDEVKLLRGLARQILWTAGRAGLEERE